MAAHGRLACAGQRSAGSSRHDLWRRRDAGDGNSGGGATARQRDDNQRKWRDMAAPTVFEGRRRLGLHPSGGDPTESSRAPAARRRRRAHWRGGAERAAQEGNFMGPHRCRGVVRAAHDAEATGRLSSARLQRLSSGPRCGSDAATGVRRYGVGNLGPVTGGRGDRGRQGELWSDGAVGTTGSLGTTITLAPTVGLQGPPMVERQQ
jgi:hypothetical protein